MAGRGTRKSGDGEGMDTSVFNNVGKPEKRIAPNKKNYNPEEANKWWLQDEKHIANAIGQVVARIENANGQRRTNFVRFAHLYGNYEALGWQNLQFLGNNNTTNNKIRLNLIQSIVDSCASKIAKDQPKPYFTTKGGDFFERLATEDCTNFVEGVFEMNKFYEKSNDVFRDGGIYGTGFVHWFIDEGKIKSEWCFVDEIKVDDYDGMMKSPRSIHRVKIWNKEVLEAKFPEYKDQLETYRTDTQGSRFRRKTSVVDMIRVRESWHLKSSAKATDGYHVITCGDMCLLKEEYEEPFFPIIPWRWYDKPLGYYGRSITEEIYSIQFEVNKLLQTAQQAYELVGIPVVFVETGSDVSEDDILQNFVARMVNYTGTMPQILTAEPLPNTFFQHLNNHIQWAFQIVGLSQSSATGTKPAGVESGQAIREVVDIETGRFAQVGSRWEDWFCENAMLVLHLAQKISKQLKKGGEDLVVSKTYKKEVMSINFSDIADISENFKVRCDPVSSLPDTPAGRTETISDYINNKWIGKERGMEMLNLDPDLDREVELQISSLRLVDKMLTSIVKTGKPEHPEPYMRLDQAMEVSLQVYNLVKMQNCPEDRLLLLRNFIDEIVTLQQAQNPLNPAPAAPPMAAQGTTANPGIAGAPPPPTGGPPPMPQQ